MAPKPLSRGIQKRSARPDAGAGGRQKAPLPDKFFLSYPKAVAVVTGKLTPVYQGGWAVKRGSDYFIYWYVRVEGEWTASSGAAVPNMSSVYAKDIGDNKIWKLWHPSAPAWAQSVPDHFM